MSHIPELRDAVIFLIGGENDAPGMSIQIVNGHVVIKPVPGWGPEAMREISQALKAVSAGVRVGNAAVSEGVANSAGTFALAEIQRYLAQAMPNHQGAMPVVIVVG